MIQFFTLGPVAFIEDGIDRYRAKHDGAMPLAIVLHPEHPADLQRQMDDDISPYQLFRLNVLVNPNCRVPSLIDRQGGWHGM